MMNPGLDSELVHSIRRTHSVLMRSAAVVVLLLGASTARADVITDWNDVLLDAIRTGRTPPPVATRAMAMVHAAMYDAVIAVEGGYEPLVYDQAGPAGASAEAAAAAAAHRALVELYPDQAETFDAALADSLEAIADGAGKASGVALGEEVADEIIAWRTGDGSTDTVEYTIGTELGDWEPTPPAFAPALLPNWPYVVPFCIHGGTQFRRPGPPPVDSIEFANNFNEVKALGGVDSTLRTDDQTEIAFFWADDPGTSTPPGHWNIIAHIIADQEGNTLVENARLFALLNITLADAAIVSWDNKYAYDDWRPVTAIRVADTDGNDVTEPDPDWISLVTTPPFPSYTSGHSTFSGSGSKIIELFYGTDEIAFTTSSDGMPGVERSFTRLSHAANEAGRSRIYGGIHWEYDNQDGLGSGRELAVFVYSNFLKPVEADDGGAPVASPCGIFGTPAMAAMFVGLVSLRLLPRRRLQTLAANALP